MWRCKGYELGLVWWCKSQITMTQEAEEGRLHFQEQPDNWVRVCLKMRNKQGWGFSPVDTCLTSVLSTKNSPVIDLTHHFMNTDFLSTITWNQDFLLFLDALKYTYLWNTGQYNWDVLIHHFILNLFYKDWKFWKSVYYFLKLQGCLASEYMIEKSYLQNLSKEGVSLLQMKFTLSE